MALQEDKTTMNIVIDKSIKHKLQILAGSDDMKLSPFVALKLQEVIEDFERLILEQFGSEDFLMTYNTIFGFEYEPYIPYDAPEEFDADAARRELIATIKGSPKKGWRKPGSEPDLMKISGELHDYTKKEPSE